MNDINSKIRRQAPLAKYAFALAFGIAFSRFFTPSINLLLIFLILSAALVLHFLIAKKNTRLPILILSFFVGAIIFIPPPNPYPDFTSQYTYLEIFAERVSLNEKGASYGIAKILAASKNFEKAKNQEIWFYVKNNNKISRGDKIKGNFIIREVENEEGFNTYLLNQNIFFNAYTADKVEVENAPFPYSFYKSINSYIQTKLSIFKSENSASEVGALATRAMILGDKSYLSKEAKDDFKLTGTMHIFAVSGLHVGMLASIIYYILNLVRLPRKLAPFVSLPILWLYVNVCQATPSAMRAFIMIACVWLAHAFLRKQKTFASLVVAFLISLLYRPSNLFDAGFALSYSVVFAIVLYATEMDELIKQKINSWRGFELKNPPLLRRFYLKSESYILLALCIGFSAMIASAPLCSYYFGYVPLLSALLSIPFVLGTTGAVFCGTASVFLPDCLCFITNSIAAFILDIMLKLAHICSNLGFVLDVKISPLAAFIGIWTILISFVYYQKIQSPLKWFLPPSLTIITLLSALIF